LWGRKILGDLYEPRVLEGTADCETCLAGEAHHAIVGAQDIADKIAGAEHPRPEREAELLLWVDAVEKVGVILLTRKNRIIGVDFLNRTFAIDDHLNQCCSESPPKSFFDSIGQGLPWR
jgi:hypothetical protein